MYYCLKCMFCSVFINVLASIWLPSMLKHVTCMFQQWHWNLTENIHTAIIFYDLILLFSEALTCFLFEMQPDLVLFTGMPPFLLFLYHVIYSFTLWSNVYMLNACCLSFPVRCPLPVLYLWQVTMATRMFNLSKAFQIFSSQRLRFSGIMIVGIHINFQRSKSHAFI